MLLATVAATLLVASSPWGAAESDRESATLTIHPRVHSAAYLPFSGALLNHNAVVDVNVYYEKKAFGFFLFQSVDLVDRHSHGNYFQPGVFASFRVQPSVRVRGIFGYVFSQTQGFRDSDSDYYGLTVVNWGISRRLRLENALQFYDYFVGKKLSDRLLVEWSSRKFRAGLYLWHRVVLDEHSRSTSGAVFITFPISKLGKRASIELTSSYMGYLSAVKPDFALQNGLLFTLAVPITVK